MAAAGNSSTDLNFFSTYPCSYGAANELCVAATDQDDNLAWFSNYGSNTVDLGAPGTTILSTIIGGTYAYFNGTSMATPHVTGAAALILARGYQSVSTLKATILNNVDPTLPGLVKTGGRLNVCKPIVGATAAGCQPPPPTPPPPPD